MIGRKSYGGGKKETLDLLWKSSAGSSITEHSTAAAELDGQILLSSEQQRGQLQDRAVQQPDPGQTPASGLWRSFSASTPAETLIHLLKGKYLLQRTIHFLQGDF